MYLNRTSMQLGKLQNLIGDLLDISKIENGKIEFNKKMFSFNPMLQNAIDVVQQTQDCTIIQKNTVEAEVYGDEMRIEQVIINYLTNAIKYSPDCKEIHVHSSITAANEICLTVKDFGIGIPPELCNHLFEKFYRVEGSSTRFQGLGIGLYISSEIIKRHKGICGVNSEPGKGSEFYFKIPLAKT
jgi:two-component system sensor histidine kinase/response regulator